MERIFTFLETFLSHPIVWGVVALVGIAIALSGRLSMNAANLVLWIAWGAAVFGVLRAEAALKSDPLLKYLILLAASSFLAIGVLLLQRWFVTKPVPVAEQPKMELRKTEEHHKAAEPPPATSPSKPEAHEAEKQTPITELDRAKKRLENNPDNLTLHDLFLTDFESVQQKNSGAIFVGEPKTISVEYSINVELAQRTKFLVFYIPRQDHTAEICEYLASQYKFVLQNAPQLWVEQKTPGESSITSTKEAIFSNRIFIYNETYLPEKQTVRLTEIYQGRGVSVIFRGIDYLSNKKLEATVKRLRRG